MAAQILVQRVEGPILLTKDGCPVWPFRDDEELAALSAIAESFGGAIHLTQAGESSNVPVDADASWVIALDEEVAGEAALYAHLTRRRFMVSNDPTALDGIALEVVVGLQSSLEDDLLAALYDRENFVAPGLITADDVALLRVEVLVRSATLSFDTRLPLRRVDVCPEAPVNTALLPSYHLFGRASSLAQCMHSIGSAAGVVTLTAHSGGIDAPLPSGALCSRTRRYTAQAARAMSHPLHRA